MADIATHVISVPLVSNLKNQVGNANSIVLTTGAVSVGDGLGKLYYFDAGDNTTPEDLINYNVITPVLGGGRYKAVFTRMIALPHGTLVMNAGKKEFFYTGTTNASSESGNVYLTMDGTAGGVAIFSSILMSSCEPNVNAATSNDVIFTSRKSLSADLKTINYKFSRPNGNSLLSLSIVTTGLTVLGSRDVPVGTSYLIKIEGK